MNRFSSLLVCGVLTGSVIACGSSSTTTDAGNTTTDAASGTDVASSGTDVASSGTDAPSGSDGASCGTGTPCGPAGLINGCYTENDPAPSCPSAHVANSATAPNFRITALSITAPATLTSSVVRGAINGFLAARTFLWGVSFNTTANTYSTGPFNATLTMPGPMADGHLQDVYSYYNGNAPTTGGLSATRWNPASGSITDMSNVVATVSPLTMAIRLPIFGAAVDGGMPQVAAELPLNNVIFHGVQLGANNGCIGLAGVANEPPPGYYFSECSSGTWQLTSDAAGTMPYGVLEADILVTDAESIIVTAFPNSPDLCSILSGEYSASPSSTCIAVPQAMWPTQPTTINNTAFHLVADFDAIAAAVAPAAM